MNWNWAVVDHWSVLLAGVGGVGSAIAATAALFAVRRANEMTKHANKITELAKDASVRLERLDHQRYRNDMTPKFQPELVDKGSDHWLLKLHYVAPLGIERLDSVSLTIRDDMPDRAENIVIAGGPTKEEVASTIWGPLRFVPRVDGADKFGRAVPGRPLQIGEALYFALQRSMKPHWVIDEDQWRQMFSDHAKGTKARFAIRCEVDGFEPWYLPFEEGVS